MKATVLLDNIGTEELTGDWGLSFYIEYAGKKILLDAGGESWKKTGRQSCFCRHPAVRTAGGSKKTI